MTRRTGRAELSRGFSPPGEVSAGKNGVFYNTHSYPTKIPPEAISPFIECFSRPGQVVLDPFCGSGMTGVAAVMLRRNVILSDISPGAAHLAYNHVTPCDSEALGQGCQRILASMNRLQETLYGEQCGFCRNPAIRIHTVWSAVYECGNCRSQFNLWTCGFNPSVGRVIEPFHCPHCRSKWRRRQLSQIGHMPSWAVIRCTQCRRKHERPIGENEGKLLSASPRRIRLPFQDCIFNADREMYIRSALHLQGIRKFSDFYTRRNLTALIYLHQAIQREKDDRLRMALMLAFTNTAWHSTRMRRFNARGGQRPLTGTLYIPQMSIESNVFLIFDHQVQQIASYFESLGNPAGHASIHESSAADLSWLSDGSVDYVFTDPPFGSNIFYADCNFVWEAWLGKTTDQDEEIVCNRSRKRANGGKGLEEYGQLLTQAFVEIARVLKPGAWASIVFHNSDDRVWRVFQDAIVTSGFSIQSVSLLNKEQWSMKGYKGRRGLEHVAFFDLVVHVRKSRRVKKMLELNGASREFLKRLLVKHLLSAETHRRPEKRLTQYLQAIAVRELIEQGYRIQCASLGEIEEICRQNFRLRDNRWYLS